MSSPNPNPHQPVSLPTSAPISHAAVAATATASADSDIPIPDYLVPVLATFDDLSAATKREHATALYCRGYRTAAISTMLGVPVRTLNRWLKDARYLLASESRVEREEHLLRAIESARAIAAEAWAAYERDCQLQREILAGQHDRLRRRITRLGRPPRRHFTPAAITDQNQDPSAPTPNHPVGASAGRPEAGAHLEATDGDILYEEFERPRYTSQAARLLTLALAAQREVARLQGLYEHVAPPRQPVDVTISGPTPATQPATPSTPSTPSTHALSSEAAQSDAAQSGIQRPDAVSATSAQPDAVSSAVAITAPPAVVPLAGPSSSPAGMPPSVVGNTAPAGAALAPAAGPMPPLLAPTPAQVPAPVSASSIPSVSIPAASACLTTDMPIAAPSPDPDPASIASTIPPSTPAAPATPASAATSSPSSPHAAPYPSATETG